MSWSAEVAVSAAVGVIAHLWTRWAFVVERPWTYWAPWLLAAVLWGLGTWAFTAHRAWFYDNAHKWSAITLFVFIIAVGVHIGVQKWRGIDELGVDQSRPWAWLYWGVAALMSAGAVAIYFAAKGAAHSFSTHRTFILEPG